VVLRAGLRGPAEAGVGFLTIPLTLYETENVEPCPYPSVEPCSDKVLGDFSKASAVIEVGDVEYQVTVDGFVSNLYNDTEPTRHWIAQELVSTDLYVVGHLIQLPHRTVPPTPKPVTPANEGSAGAASASASESASENARESASNDLLGQRNVVGEPLAPCDPQTGFVRDGYCRAHHADGGAHHVCAVMTAEFLAFSASAGNDLRGVVSPGGRWCLCTGRWLEAQQAGAAPPVVLDATNEVVLQHVRMSTLRASVSSARDE
jgi:uncharacterized protein (DUF2237 family)